MKAQFLLSLAACSPETAKKQKMPREKQEEEEPLLRSKSTVHGKSIAGIAHEPIYSMQRTGSLGAAMLERKP